MKTKEEEDLEKVAVIFIIVGLLSLWGAFASGSESLFYGAVFSIISIVCITIGWVILYYRGLARKEETEFRRQNNLNRMAKKQPLVEKINKILYDEADRIHRDKRGKKKSKYKTEPELTYQQRMALHQQRQSLKHRLKERNVHLNDFSIESMSEESMLEITELIKNIPVLFDPSTLPYNGHEFEHWVAKNLNKFGWNANVTSGSGDQGIDVIARKNGRTLGLQCKLLKSPVGNKAVQEAYAGKAFYQMDVVGVISNASYTKSAKALAMNTGVKLLSHRDIPNLYERMFNR